MMIRFILVLVVFAGSGTRSFALQPQDVRELFVIVAPSDAGKGPVRKQRYPYADFRRDAKAEQVMPHAITNPKKETATWTGVSLRRLLAKSIRPNGQRVVVVTGADGYSSQFGENLLTQHDVFLSLEKNGKPIAASEGGPTLTFPLADAKLPAQFRNEPWWVWFVSAIFVGTPPPEVTVRAGGTSRSLNLPDLTKETTVTTLPPCYPAGQRELVPPRTAQQVSHVPLASVVGDGKAATLEGYFGRTLPLGAAVADYQLAYAWNGKPIPPAFGGPVYAFRPAKPTECFHFVEGVNVP